MCRYDNYPTHCSTDFVDLKTNHCRIAKVEPDNRAGLGAASLNLTDIRETDRGWYNCKVVLLNRQPSTATDYVSNYSRPGLLNVGRTSKDPVQCNVTQLFHCEG